MQQLQRLAGSMTELTGLLGNYTIGIKLYAASATPNEALAHSWGANKAATLARHECATKRSMMLAHVERR